MVRLDYDKADIFLKYTPQLDLNRAGACAKEPWTVSWIETHVRAGQAFYDIGANVGAYSLVAAKSTQGRARVYAFEPAFANYGSLCENIHTNDCDECISPFPFGLSAATELSVFKYRDLRAGAGVHRMGSAVKARFDPVYSQPVITFRLDDFVRQFRLPRPNHIKLDVDGTELEVIRGAKECLTGPAFRSLMMELEDAQSGRILKELNQIGLEMVQQTKKVNKQGEEMSVWYGLFVRS